MNCCSGWVRGPGARCWNATETRRQHCDGDLQCESVGRRSGRRLDTAMYRWILARTGVLQLLHGGHQQLTDSPHRRRQRPVLDRRTFLSSRHVSIQSVLVACYFVLGASPTCEESETYYNKVLYYKSSAAQQCQNFGHYCVVKVLQ